MRRSRVILAAVVAALALGMTSPASAAGEAMVGLGNAGVGGQDCSPDALQLVLEGVETAEDHWTFDVAAANREPLCVVGEDFPLVALSLVFSGEWTPAGGCMPVVGVNVLFDFELCLTDPQVNGDVITYRFEVCEPAEQCDDEAFVEMLYLA